MSMQIWQQVLDTAKQQPSFLQAKTTVAKARDAGAVVFPPAEQLLAAFDLLKAPVSVVILGQDPYHQKGQANGLAFSVNRGVKLPPSLRNIYKELAADLGVLPPAHGDLSHWAAQGVLLLNTVLTVEEGRANAHQGIGWEAFTDSIIHGLSEASPHLVFLLWGKSAQAKRHLIADRHTVLMAAHPSPLSAYRGFFGSRPFSQTNQALLAHQQSPIQWVE